MKIRVRWFLVFVLGICFCAPLWGQQPLLRLDRIDTSRVMGSPDPLPAMRIERAFPKLRFASPVQPTHAGDGTNRAFVVTQNGMIHVFPNQPDASSTKVFLDIRDRVTNPGGDNGMFALAFHPQFQTNGEFFVVYGTRSRPKATAVSRFKVSGEDPNRADPDSEERLLQIQQPWPDHNAACLAFGPDGYLYVSLGDGGYSLQNGNAQNLSTLLGAMLRMDVDRRDPGLNYGIPKDNPFTAVDSARDEIWAYGLRAPWRFSFDRLTGDCWLGDNGQVEFEEVDLIKRGANYGWMVREGLHAFDPASADSRGRRTERKQRQRDPQVNRDDGFTDPIVEYDHSQGRSVVGGIVYRGWRLPELIGAYVYGDYANGNIWALRWDGEKVVDNQLIARTRLKISSFGEDERGELWFSAMDGHVYRLRPAKPTSESEFPQWLSETGLFESTREHQPLAGVIPYWVNVPFWSDGALKQRFIALPETNSVGFRKSATWQFPVGTVFVKTFSLELVPGDSDSSRRLETRLLIHNPRGWAGYTYRWKDDQSDAYLLGGATTELIEVRAGDKVSRQPWYYPSRSDCFSCHTQKAGFVLGGNTLQLNRQQTYGTSAANQLEAFERAGVFKGRPSKPHADLPSHPDWNSGNGTLSERARAYLDVNCSTCHTPPGYTKLDLRWNTQLDQTETINRNLEKPGVGPPGSKIIWPGAADRSELYLRMLHQGTRRMPSIGSYKVDDAGVQTIKAWIESLEEE